MQEQEAAYLPSAMFWALPRKSSLAGASSCVATVIITSDLKTKKAS